MGPELIPSAIKAANAEGLLKEIYGDLAKPGVTQVGLALSTVIGLGRTILWPLQLINERSRMLLEHNLDRYREKLKSIPLDRIAPVPTEIGVPLVEKLDHVTDPDLMELYASLLASASNKDSQNRVHPSFVHILANISPDEAHLVKDLAEASLQPFVSVRLINPTEQTWIELADIYFDTGSGASMQFPDNLSAYVHNLEGLGLLDVRRDNYAAPYDRYDPIEASARARFENVRLLDGFNVLSFVRGKIEVTRLGWMFISACLGGISKLPPILRGGF